MTSSQNYILYQKSRCRAVAFPKDDNPTSQNAGYGYQGRAAALSLGDNLTRRVFSVIRM